MISSKGLQMADDELEKHWMPAYGSHFQAVRWFVPPIFWKSSGTFGEWDRAITPSHDAEPNFWGVRSLTSLMVSRLTEEFQAQGFYGQDWFKLFGSLHRSSDVMIKLITL